MKPYIKTGKRSKLLQIILKKLFITNKTTERGRFEDYGRDGLPMQFAPGTRLFEKIDLTIVSF